MANGTTIATGRCPRVLFVDDDELFIFLVSSYLSDHHLDCCCESNSLTALDLITKEDFDLVFLDLSVPLMNGAEWLAKARAVKPNLNVVILTGGVDEFMAKKLVGLGSITILYKPISYRSLQPIIDHITKEPDAWKWMERIASIGLGRLETFGSPA